jgi:hypothetical protein
VKADIASGRLVPDRQYLVRGRGVLPAALASYDLDADGTLDASEGMGRGLQNDSPASGKLSLRIAAKADTPSRTLGAAGLRANGTLPFLWNPDDKDGDGRLSPTEWAVVQADILPGRP